MMYGYKHWQKYASSTKVGSFVEYKPNQVSTDSVFSDPLDGIN
jgi:hypothetical protein